MNDLRNIDPFALDPFEDAWRGLMRPWRLDGGERVPQIGGSSRREVRRRRADAEASQEGPRPVAATDRWLNAPGPGPGPAGRCVAALRWGRRATAPRPATVGGLSLRGFSGP